MHKAPHHLSHRLLRAMQRRPLRRRKAGRTAAPRRAATRVRAGAGGGSVCLWEGGRAGMLGPAQRAAPRPARVPRGGRVACPERGPATPVGHRAQALTPRPSPEGVTPRPWLCPRPCPPGLPPTPPTPPTDPTLPSASLSCFRRWIASVVAFIASFRASLLRRQGWDPGQDLREGGGGWAGGGRVGWEGVWVGQQEACLLWVWVHDRARFEAPARQPGSSTRAGMH